MGMDSKLALPYGFGLHVSLGGVLIYLIEGPLEEWSI